MYGNRRITKIDNSGKTPANSLANRPSSRAGSATSWGRSNKESNPPLPPKTVKSPATARLGTANVRPGSSIKGLGLNANDRPTTQQGLGGIRMTGNTGTGRVIRDKTYFMSELRLKMNLISSELNQLNSEYETISKENANITAFENKADSVAEELKEMQSELGDYNTLVDKINTNNDLDDFERQYQQLKAKNQRELNVLDDIFVQRQQKEMHLKEIEKLIEEERENSEAQILQLEPSKRQLYNNLKIENQKYTEEINQKQTQINELKQKIAGYQNDLKNAPLKQKAVILHQRISESRNKKNELETFLKSGNSESAADEKARLLEKVKEDNMEISALERKISEFNNEINEIKEQMQHIDNDNDPASNERNLKYQELLKRDKEMTVFLEEFEDKKIEIASKNEISEKKIIDLLENIRVLSKADTSNLPSSDGYRNIKGDLAAKEKEIKNSELTLTSILAEKNKRIDELEKVNQLESKVRVELEQLSSKIEKMKQDKKTFANIDEIKRSAEEAKSKNLAMREILQYQRDSSSLNVKMLSENFDSKRKQLNDNETYTQLCSLEQKLRNHESNNYHLLEYIQSKTAESDYKPIQRDVKNLMGDIQNQLVKLMSLPPTR